MIKTKKGVTKMKGKKYEIIADFMLILENLEELKIDIEDIITTWKKYRKEMRK